MKKAIRIGDRTYPTKKAATEAVRCVLYRYAIGQYVDDEDFDFLLDLIQLHPEAPRKIGVGIVAFSVEQNLGSRGFWLTRVDGSRSDWSFLACLTPPTPEQEAAAGFRNAVRDQIQRAGWVEFHRVNAGLRPVTQTANLSVLRRRSVRGV